MILVDTSVWVDHLRRGNARLSELLNEGAVLGHSFVVGELACGSLRNRVGILALLGELPQAPSASPGEVMSVVASRRLLGRGLGYVDCPLLASAMLLARRSGRSTSGWRRLRGRLAWLLNDRGRPTLHGCH